jgi:hypothetical protein
VIWTRGRWAPDLLPRICDWFAGRGFDQLWVSDPAEDFGAGAHRFTGTPDPLEPGARMFTFRDHHPRIGPPRHLPLSTERPVVLPPGCCVFPRPFPARGPGAASRTPRTAPWRRPEVQDPRHLTRAHWMTEWDTRQAPVAFPEARGCRRSRFWDA